MQERKTRRQRMKHLPMRVPAEALELLGRFARQYGCPRSEIGRRLLLRELRRLVDYEPEEVRGETA